jgi:hypothetical protein
VAHEDVQETDLESRDLGQRVEDLGRHEVKSAWPRRQSESALHPHGRDRSRTPSCGDFL